MRKGIKKRFMEHKSKRNFRITGALGLLFAAFTAIVATVDVRPIGPEQSSVGLAALNRFAAGLLGVNPLWYDITEWLGAVAVLFALGFAVLGLCQLIRRRSLLKVEPRILLLGAFYIAVALVYLFFERVIINYRPVILDAGLEASYPSSHTVIAICIFGTAIMQFHHYLRGKTVWLVIMDSATALLMAVTVIGRLLSGVHWFTDIAGGVLLSSALIMLYASAVSYVECRKKV